MVICHPSTEAIVQPAMPPLPPKCKNHINMCRHHSFHDLWCHVLQWFTRRFISGGHFWVHTTAASCMKIHSSNQFASLLHLLRLLPRFNTGCQLTIETFSKVILTFDSTPKSNGLFLCPQIEPKKKSAESQELLYQSCNTLLLRRDESHCVSEGSRCIMLYKLWPCNWPFVGRFHIHRTESVIFWAAETI